MSDVGQVKLVLFFTRGVSLRTWDRVGILEREVALYRAMRPHLHSVTFVTYGNARDLDYADRLAGIRILCNRWGLPQQWYIRLLSWLYPVLGRGFTVLKSNQVRGADVPLLAAHRFGKKFIARCGYLPSTKVIWRYGEESLNARRTKQLEARVFRGADRVVVTTAEMLQTIVERYDLNPEKVRVIPNYVDTQRFKPSSNSRQPNLVCSVGHLKEVKNIQALLDAIHGLDVELAVIGGGSLEQPLKTKVEKEQLPVRFLGVVPNTELPAYLNRASLFILPSHFEHHPKALLEAMACGLPVIGTNVPGIRELIDHRATGYLCGTSPEEIRTAIQEVLGDADLRAHMGRNAREFVVEHFALERVVEMELALLGELAE